MSSTVPDGFRLAATDAGLAKGRRPDLLLAVADEACPAAACFTTNQIVASPVALSREHLRQNGGVARAILVNAGFANAGAGAQGDEDALQCARWVAELVGCDVLEVLVFSTGVIGARLPVERIEATLPALHDELSASAGAVEQAARAILTTDTVPKIAGRDVKLANGREAHVLGLAKGSGMIHPNMATMLAFLLTDHDSGQGMDVYLRGAVRESFHCISVDGDTSTNDSVLLWSSARDGGEPAQEAGVFNAIRDVSTDLAKAIARDGEGATKLIEVAVRGALTPDAALAVARTVATSLLVRTAVHGHDPNWGRILAAAGRSGVDLNTRKLQLGIGPATLFANDEPHAENEPEARTHLEGDEVRIWLDLAAGACEASFWTCDLTEGYIRINAEYRT